MTGSLAGIQTSLHTGLLMCIKLTLHRDIFGLSHVLMRRSPSFRFGDPEGGLYGIEAYISVTLVD